MLIWTPGGSALDNEVDVDASTEIENIGENCQFEEGKIRVSL